MRAPMFLGLAPSFWLLVIVIVIAVLAAGVFMHCEIERRREHRRAIRRLLDGERP